MIRLLAHPVPPSPSATFLFLSLPLSSVDLTCKRGEGGGRRSKSVQSYDREKAWPSINHSILSGIGLRQNVNSRCPNELYFSLEIHYNFECCAKLLSATASIFCINGSYNNNYCVPTFALICTCWLSK
jgi:hypothetical protein